jgi:hypothetical protein
MQRFEKARPVLDERRDEIDLDSGRPYHGAQLFPAYPRGQRFQRLV